MRTTNVSETVLPLFPNTLGDIWKWQESQISFGGKYKCHGIGADWTTEEIVRFLEFGTRKTTPSFQFAVDALELHKL